MLGFVFKLVICEPSNCREVTQAPCHTFNHLIRRGSSGRNSNDVVYANPFFAQITGGVDVMNSLAKTQTGFDQLVRVVAMRTADDDDYVTFLRKFTRRILPLLRRLANRVHETHLGIGKAFLRSEEHTSELQSRQYLV